MQGYNIDSATLSISVPYYKSIIKAPNKPLILYQFQSNTNPNIHQSSDILSISEHYPDQNSTSLCSSINLRVLSSPVFNKPLIFYQFQGNIEPIIYQASDLPSISEHYPAHHSTSLWSYINLRAIYSPSFIKPMILYQFQSIIQPRIHQASDLLSILEHYPSHNSTSLLSSINFRAIYSPTINIYLKHCYTIFCLVSWYSSSNGVSHCQKDIICSFLVFYRQHF